MYIVTARATDKDGRIDESIGAVNIANKKGDDMAIAIMRAETKAKRRVTLSISGLGWLEESEVTEIKGAEIIENHITIDESINLHKIQMQECKKDIYHNEDTYKDKIKERGKLLDDILLGKGYKKKNAKGYISTQYITPEDYTEIKETLETAVQALIKRDKEELEEAERPFAQLIETKGE